MKKKEKQVSQSIKWKLLYQPFQYTGIPVLQFFLSLSPFSALGFKVLALYFRLYNVCCLCAIAKKKKKSSSGEVLLYFETFPCSINSQSRSFFSIIPYIIPFQTVIGSSK